MTTKEQMAFDALTRELADCQAKFNLLQAKFAVELCDRVHGIYGKCTKPKGHDHHENGRASWDDYQCLPLIEAEKHTYPPCYDCKNNIGTSRYRCRYGCNTDVASCSQREPKDEKPTVAFAIEGQPATAGECAAFIQGVQSEKEAQVVRSSVEPCCKPAKGET